MTRIAEDMFPELEGGWTALADEQQRVVIVQERVEWQWRIEFSPNLVRATNCEGHVEVPESWTRNMRGA